MSSLPIQFVHTRPLLQEMMDAIRDEPRLAFDTEFVGEHTYQPVLCLIQIASPRGIWILDPLAVTDLSEFWQLLTDPQRELVVVAAREEVRFCRRYAGRLPEKVLDLQIVGGMLGLGFPLSHTNLVRKVMDVEVNGRETFTDWRRRPLSKGQIEYAADDVAHLLEIREKLMADAESLGRVGWIEEMCRAYVQKSSGEVDEERWRRLPGANSMRRRDLALLRELWDWRESTAAETDVPARRILRDEMIVEITKRKPTSVGDLMALRGMERGIPKTAPPQILAAVQRAAEIPDPQLPQINRRHDPPQLGLLSQMLGLLTGNLASQHRIDPSLLATASDLQDVVRWRLNNHLPQPECLRGWRGEILREPLMQMLDGNIGLRIRNLKSATPLSFE